MWYLVGETAGGGRDLGPLLFIAFAGGTSELASNEPLAEGARHTHLACRVAVQSSLEARSSYRLLWGLRA